MASPSLFRPGTVLLDTVRTDAENRWTLLFTEPVRILEARTLDEVGPLLEALDAAVAEGLWAAGFLSYEAGFAFERVGAAPVGERLAWFGLYRGPHRLNAGAAGALLTEGEAAVRDARFAWDRTTYRTRIARVKKRIREGDVYQVNLTAPVDFRLEGTPLALYRRLRAAQGVPYGAYLDLGDTQILSVSPELFFRRHGDRIVTRPMKGTAPRGRTPAEDAERAAALAADPKNRAENLMIVDLLRNDLSVVCRPGSVRVPELFRVEPYRTVLQMTSTVEGRLRPDVGYAALFRALFPCGSVTGAPKIRAMQEIQALEDGPRGVYCGAVGYAAPGGKAAFNVAIRTAVVREGRGRLGVGSGVVWDSDADAEYDECLLKARFLTHADEAATPFALIETMRWEGGRIELLGRHAARMEASAAYFGYAFDADRFRRLVAARTQALDPATPHRVRVTLGPEGRFDVRVTPLDAAALPHPVRLVVAEERVDAEDVFHYHKTTRRARLERAYEAARAAGYDEALLLNTRGEVAEGTRTNVFVRQGDRLLTPPVTSGLLGGVYRAHVLATHPEAGEAVLWPEDLRRADGLFVCNAVWGWRPAVLAADPPGATSA